MKANKKTVIKVRNYHAINAWNRVSAGAFKKNNKYKCVVDKKDWQ